MTRTVVGLVLALSVVLLMGTGAAVTAEGERLGEIRTDVRENGVYVGPVVASGRTELWERRLRRALRRADFAHPVSVALWTDVDGIDPRGVTSEADPADLFEMLGLRRGGLVVLDGGILHVATHRVPDAFRDRLLFLWEREMDISAEVVAASSDPERYRGLTDVAHAWLLLRLADPNPPSARQLVDELSDDHTVLQDHAAPARRTGYDDGDLLHMKDLWVAGVVLLVTTAVFVAWSRRTAPRRRQEADPFASELTSLVVNEELADLAEQIAASEVAPGDPDYDRAQACADAAAQYVDSDLQRDRVGAHLLVEDGLRALRGSGARDRCYFHPAHRGTTHVQRDGKRVACCPACADAVVDGRRPQVLLVAGADGEVAPYYETSDVWTDTGYGAVDELYARRALLAALESR